MIAATTTTTTSTYADECVRREWQGNRNRVLCTEKKLRERRKKRVSLACSSDECRGAGKKDVSVEQQRCGPYL